MSGRALFQLCPTFMTFTKIFGISSGEWNAMSFYGRFEQIVTWILTLCVGPKKVVDAFNSLPAFTHGSYAPFGGTGSHITSSEDAR
jgi:hypothetical protein